MFTQKLVFFSLIVTLMSSCTPPINDTNRNAIALCSGGYSSSIKADLEASYGRFGGKFISNGKINEGGGELLKIGNKEGKYAVDFYNSYIKCIREHTKNINTPQRPKIQTNNQDLNHTIIQGSVIMNSTQN